MLLLRLLAAVILSVGAYTLLNNILRPHSTAAAKAIHRLSGKPTGFRSKMVIFLAEKIQPFIHLAPYARQELMDNLLLVDDDPDPEFYVASNIVSSSRYIVIGLISVLVSAVIGNLIATQYPAWVWYVDVTGWVLCGYSIYYAIKLYRKRKSGLTKAAKEKRDERDAELPRFASFFIRAIKTRHDLYAITAEYRPNAGKEFGRTLDRTLIRMRIVGPEAALQEFAASMGSPLVADLVTGLIGAVHGEDMDSLLANVEARFDEMDLNNLNRESELWYQKLSLPIFLAYVCMVAVFFTGFGEYIYHLYK